HENGASEGTLNVKPMPNASGTANARVTVTDDGPDGLPHENSAFVDITINVNDVIAAPVITDQDPVSVVEDNPFTILVDYLTISDTDGDTEFTLAVQLPDNPNYTSAGAVITPDPNFNGQLTIPIVVNDGTADSPVFNFVLEVTAANDLPVISGQVNPARQMNEDA